MQKWVKTVATYKVFQRIGTSVVESMYQRKKRLASYVISQHLVTAFYQRVASLGDTFAKRLRMQMKSTLALSSMAL